MSPPPAVLPRSPPLLPAFSDSSSASSNSCQVCSESSMRKLGTITSLVSVFPPTEKNLKLLLLIPNPTGLADLLQSLGYKAVLCFVHQRVRAGTLGAAFFKHDVPGPAGHGERRAGTSSGDAADSRAGNARDEQRSKERRGTAAARPRRRAVGHGSWCVSQQVQTHFVLSFSP